MSTSRERYRERPAAGGARSRPRGPQSELLQRILVAVPALVVVALAVAQGGVVFALLVAVLGVVCLGELYVMFERAHPARLAGMLGLVGMVAAGHFGSERQVVLALALCVPVTFALVVAQPRGGAAAVAVTLLGPAWIGLGLACAVLLRDLPHGAGIVVDVLVGTFVGDTAAYLGGRAVGRRPLAPRISPNKTVEGLALGAVMATAAVWFAGLYQDWLGGWDALLLGLAVAVAAPIGDLFESFLKRDAGTKDTGRLFGAHGGALDRLDAVLFTAVAGYFVWLALL